MRHSEAWHVIADDIGRSTPSGLVPQQGHTPATVQAPCCALMQCLCERFTQQKKTQPINAGCTAAANTVLAARLAWPLTKPGGWNRFCITAWQDMHQQH